MMGEQIVLVFRALSTTAKAAVVIAGVALVVVLWMSVGVLGAMMRPALIELTGPGEGSGANLFAAALDDDLDFIVGKSVFFPPTRRVVDPVGPVGPIVTPTTRYAGPKLMGLSGHFAYFDRAVLKGGKEIRVGEEGGTVEVMQINPPFEAVVKYQAKEWTLNLLETKTTFGASGFGTGSTNADRLGVSNSGSPNPFTQRGSSPNGNDLFGESSRQPGSFGGGRGAPVPAAVRDTAASEEDN